MFIAALLAAAAVAPAFSPGPLTAANKASIIRYFDSRMLDGKSARWKWPAARPRNHGAYCGWVNAKNGFGAYTGWRPFYVFRGDDGKLGGDMWQEGHTAVLETLCGSAGYDYVTPPE